MGNWTLLETIQEEGYDDAFTMPAVLSCVGLIFNILDICLIFFEFLSVKEVLALETILIEFAFAFKKYVFFFINCL